DQPGTGGLLEGLSRTAETDIAPATDTERTGIDHNPSVDDLVGPPRDPVTASVGAGAAAPDRRRSAALPDVEPDPAPGEGRSRFDAEASVVLYNERHADCLLGRDAEAALLDYIATPVAQEHLGPS